MNTPRDPEAQAQLKATAQRAMETIFQDMSGRQYVDKYFKAATPHVFSVNEFTNAGLVVVEFDFDQNRAVCPSDGGVFAKAIENELGRRWPTDCEVFRGTNGMKSRLKMTMTRQQFEELGSPASAGTSGENCQNVIGDGSPVADAGRSTSARVERALKLVPPLQEAA